MLTRSCIRQLAQPRDYLAAMRRAFGGLARHEYELPAVGHIAGRNGAFHIKSAAQRDGAALAAIKVNGNFPGNPATWGLPTIQGFMALLDSERGCVLALMDSVEITARRTAAATALAAQHLARRDARVLALIGCGTQAVYHLDALVDVLEIDAVRFFDPRPQAVEAFERHAREVGMRTERTASARACAHEAEIVVTLTPSTHPILGPADVAPGAFVAGVGADNPSKSELAPALLRESRVVVDVLEQSASMGDLHHAIAAGAMTAEDVHAALADLVAGVARGRTSPHERFVFDSTGVALQDLAAAEMLFERAQQRADTPSVVLDDTE
ncbi:MAG TPA: ornithine cyclodeaminase family protein [Steroidobacteraceae bacterium]|nr:ornithine cyclodeaminase family protein [Steroidobacteraceae bacterium]